MAQCLMEGEHDEKDEGRFAQHGSALAVVGGIGHVEGQGEQCRATAEEAVGHVRREPGRRPFEHGVEKEQGSDGVGEPQAEGH